MKNIVITGCNRGLGLELVKHFASLKYNIIACVRVATEDFIQLCKLIENEENIKIYPIAFELSDEASIIKGINQIIDMDINIDVLVNSAGIYVMKPMLFTEYQDILESFKINYFAPFLITKLLAEKMIRQDKGSIINITSILSMGQKPGGSCYNTSKAALNQFTTSIAQELAPFNLRVNAVACGPIETEMFLTMQDKVKKKIIQNSALKRVATTNEIAKVVSFLASEEASYITGQIIRVDGGTII